MVKNSYRLINGRLTNQFRPNWYIDNCCREELPTLCKKCADKSAVASDPSISAIHCVKCTPYDSSTVSVLGVDIDEIDAEIMHGKSKNSALSRIKFILGLSLTLTTAISNFVIGITLYDKLESTWEQVAISLQLFGTLIGLSIVAHSVYRMLHGVIATETQDYVLRFRAGATVTTSPVEIQPKYPCEIRFIDPFNPDDFTPGVKYLHGVFHPAIHQRNYRTDIILTL